MKQPFAVLILASVAFLSHGQVRKKMPLEDVVKFWSDTDFQTSTILDLMDANGLDFQMSPANLASLLEAGRKGGRPPTEVAQVIYRVFRECQTCRADFWRPLRKEDLLFFLEKKDSAFAVAELAARGGDKLPLTADFLRELARKGAKEDLLLVINEKIRIEPPQKFIRISPTMQRAGDFKLQPMAGKLVLSLDFPGAEIEFIFRHDSLFYRVINGVEPKNLGSYFTSFGPQGEEKDIAWKIEDKPKVDPRNVKAAFVTDPSGLNGFNIRAKSGKKPFELHITWRPKSAGAT
jgi:hypothetical protein